MNTWRYLLFGCGQFGMMALARFFFMWIIKYPDETSGTVPGLKIPIFEGVKVPMPLADPFGDPVAFLFGAAATVGLVFLGFRIFDGVTDPIAGMLSDGWVKRGHERRTLLLFAFLFPPLGLAMVFWPDGSLSPALRWVFLGGGMFVFFVGYTFYAIPYWSLLDDYSHGDEGTRRVMSNVLGAGLLAATLAGFVISGDLIESFGYRTAALWFSGPALVLMVFPFFARPPGDPPPPKLGGREETQVGAFEGFLLAFKHRRFLAVLVIFTGSQMAFSVMTGAAPVIVDRLLGGTESDLKFVMGPFLLTALPCFVFVPMLSKRFGWQKTVAMASIILGVVYAGTAFLGDPVIHSKTVTAGVLFGLGGPMAAVLLGLEGEAVTACADEAGGKVTSVYFGVFNFVVKGMNGVAVFLTTYLSDLSKGDLGDTAVRAMGIMAGCMLAVGVGLYYMIRPKEVPPKPEGEAPAAEDEASEERTPTAE